MRLSFSHTPWWLFLLPLSVACTMDQINSAAKTWSGKNDSEIQSNVKEAPSPRISPKTHFAAGTMLERQGNYQGAIKQYQKAIKTDPSMSKAYNRLGIIYQRLNHLQEAEDIFRQGIRVKSDSPAMYNNLGFCYLLENNYPDAEQAFRAALALSPKFHRARMNLAIALARMKMLGDSILEFKQVLPEEVAYYNLAVICLDTGDYPDAQKALRNSLIVNPDYAPAKQQLHHLTRLVKKIESQRSHDSSGSAAVSLDGASDFNGPVDPIPLAGRSDDQPIDPS